MENFFRKHDAIDRTVKMWLILGLVMIFFQVVIGGITRLTGSGLSITKWEIVTGTLPPVNKIEWEEAFDFYKETPQYQKINEGMSMSEFKFIYFWEYIHRLWARTMGFVFLIPFLIFLFTKRFSKRLLKQLVVVFLLAALVASLGWIMVASGLVDRPWVNAYKLTAHLSLAFILFGVLLWTVYGVFFTKVKVTNNRLLKRWGIVLTSLLALQIVLGGIMSGMKAGLSYPDWPYMNKEKREIIPDVLFDTKEWNVNNLKTYDTNGFAPALIQVMHRSTAYLLIIIGLWYFIKGIRSNVSPLFRRGLNMWITMLVIQIILGIITVLNCRGSIPVDWGVLHQGGALLLLSAMLFINFLTLKPSN